MKSTIKIRFTEPQIALVMRAHPNCNLDRLTELSFEFDQSGKIIDCIGTIKDGGNIGHDYSGIDFATNEASDAEEMAKILEGTGNYRILRRLRPRDRFAVLSADEAKHTGVVLDVETTGLDSSADDIIEIGLIKFVYSDGGEIDHVVDTFSSLNEPRISIPSEVVELTGITQELVAGHHIDPEALTTFVADAEIVVAHNARYDRRMCERHWEVFKNIPWACSATQVEWRKHGFESARLNHLLRGIGLFHDGHRAIEDCYAVLEILAYPLKAVNQPAMALIMEQARRTVVRVWAEGASYSVKDELKARGYKWNNGADGRPRSWYRDVDESAGKHEVEYLKRAIYRRDVDIRLQPIDSLNRFSVRD